MSQTTYLQMANEPGAPFRQHLNEALGALNTGFAGATAPSVTVAHMIWLDTSVTPYVRRRRNSTNTAWVADFAASAGLTMTADKVVYATGADTYGTMTVTSVARSLLDDSSTTSMLSTLGAAPLASPSFTGTPWAPTPTAGDNSTRVATTAYVQTSLQAVALPSSPSFAGNVRAYAFRANKGTPNSGDGSTNGYSFQGDGDTGFFAADGGENSGTSEIRTYLDASHKHTINSSGQIWTSAYGYVHDYINARADAYTAGKAGANRNFSWELVWSGNPNGNLNVRDNWGYGLYSVMLGDQYTFLVSIAPGSSWTGFYVGLTEASTPAVIGSIGVLAYGSCAVYKLKKDL